MTETIRSWRSNCLRGLGMAAVVLCAAALTGLSAQAQQSLDITADHEIGELGLQPAGEKIELTIEDAYSLALERNLSLLVERYRYTQSILGIDEARGIYDLNLQADFSRLGSSAPVTSALVDVDGNQETSTNTPFSIGLSQLFFTGGTLSLQWDGNRSGTNNRNQVVNPLYRSGLNLQASQPLLRNFGRLATERSLIIAKTSRAISQEALQLEVENILQSVSDTYWELVEAREQLAVAEESLKLAEELHEMNRIQVEVGTLPPLDLVQSEAGVATRQEDIIRRSAVVEDREDDLRQLLNFNQGELWDVSIMPVSEAEIPFREIDVRTAIREALNLRPDLRRQRLQNENQDVEYRYARNQAKPNFSVTANYGISGSSGGVVDENGLPIPDQTFGDTLDVLSDGDFDNWTIRLDFSYPLQNRAAKARRAVAELALEQSNIELDQLEQSVITEVRRTARAVRTAAQQIESSKISSRLARENLKAEEKRYENGIVTSFQILEIQEDLSQARSREVAAIASYRRALTAFYRTTGQLLREMSVTLGEGAGEPE